MSTQESLEALERRIIQLEIDVLTIRLMLTHGQVEFEDQPTSTIQLASHRVRSTETGGGTDGTESPV